MNEVPVKTGSPQYIAELTASYINALQKNRKRYQELLRWKLSDLRAWLLQCGDEEVYTPQSIKKFTKHQLVYVIIEEEKDNSSIIEELEDLGVDTAKLEEFQLFGAIA